MTSDFIIGGVALVALLILVGFWPSGRAIVLEALFHPFRKSVITRDANGKITVQVSGKDEWQNSEAKKSGTRLEIGTHGTSQHPIS